MANEWVRAAAKADVAEGKALGVRDRKSVV